MSAHKSSSWLVLALALAIVLGVSSAALAAGSGSGVYVISHANPRGESAPAPHPLAAAEGLALKAVVLENGRALGLAADGTVWAWTSSTAPRRVPRLKGIGALAAGNRHYLALASDGTVWAWGANGSGQLGDGMRRDRTIPVQVPSLTHVKAIAAGGRHSLALGQDGTVWAWGANDRGQLGDGTEISSDAPVAVAGLSHATAIAAGSAHSLALDASGAIWAWGADDRGQLGDGSASDRHTPAVLQLPVRMTSVAAGQESGLAIASDGAAWCWGASAACPAQVPGPSGVSSLSASAQHALAVDAEGALWAWDLPTTDAPHRIEGLPPVASAAAGTQQDLALAACGIVCEGIVPDTGMSGAPVTLKANIFLPPTCSGTPSFDWDFGDGSAHGTEQNPVHVYDAPGAYTWSYVVTNPGAPQPCGDSGTIDICEFTCDAQASPNTGLPPLPVQFSASAAIVGICSDPVVYAWDFGDGTTSTEQNPAHTYTGEGVFTWTLQVTSGGLSCSKSGQILVPCSTLLCTTAVPTSSQPGRLLQFTGGVSPLSCPDPIVVSWDFGDGSPHANTLSATHTYNAAGTFTWTFSATSGQAAQCSKTGTVNVVNPPVVTSMKKVTPPFKIVILGSNLQSGIKVFIDGVEWTSVVYKNTGKIQLTGSGLKAAVPKGTTKTFRFLNPDGGETSTPWGY